MEWSSHISWVLKTSDHGITWVPPTLLILWQMTFLQWTCHIFLPFSFLGLDVSRGSLKRPIPPVIIQKKKDFLKVFIFFPQGTDLTNRSPEIQILIGKRKEGVGEVFERRWAQCQGVIFSTARSTHALSQQSQRNLGDRGWGSIKMVNS